MAAHTFTCFLVIPAFNAFTKKEQRLSLIEQPFPITREEAKIEEEMQRANLKRAAMFGDGPRNRRPREVSSLDTIDGLQQRARNPRCD